MTTMMLSISAVPGASDIGADGLVLYEYSAYITTPDEDHFDPPPGYEATGPAVIVAMDGPSAVERFLWARAFALTDDERDRRYEEQQQLDYAKQREQRAAIDAHVAMRLDVLWTQAGLSGERPSLDEMKWLDMRQMCWTIKMRCTGRQVARAVLTDWAEGLFVEAEA